MTRTQPADPLREVGGRSPLALRRGVRMTLIAAQVALTVLLLIGAGLMVRTFIRVLSEPTGFHTAGRLTVNLTLPPSRYGDADAIRRGRQALDERFAAIAGVFAFGVNNNLPLSGSDSRRGITVEGLQRTPGDDPVRAHTRIVTPGYFAAAGIATREGRLFTGADDERAPLVVLINETMARRYWPGQSPIGKRIRFNSEGDPWRQVIGVIGDVKHWGLDREVNPETYLPHAQQPSATLTYVFHTVGNPLTIISPLAAAVREVDPDLPLGSVRTFDQVAAAAMATRRWSAMLLGVLALLGIGLAAAGVYGVMSHVVTLQAAEISIRLSLGATRGAVLRRVLADAVVNTSVGVILGLLAGVAFAQLLQSLLFGVTPLDPATFSAAAGLVIVAAVLAALAPALTAMRIDPAEALRQS